MKYSCILLFLLINHFSFAQGKQSIKSAKYHFSFSSELNQLQTQAITSYIDGQVAKIELVTLSPECEIYKVHVGDTIVAKEMCNFSSIIHKNGVDETRISQRAKLDESDFKNVFQGVYGSGGNSVVADCYEPRHGICFYDSTGKLIGFLELCFECSNSEHKDIPQYGLIFQSGFGMLEKLFGKYLLN